MYMRLYWIFDLDYTLYNIDPNLEFDYDLLSEDKYLQHLLSSKPFSSFPQFIFTNAMKVHADNCLSIMNLNTFESIYARDTMNDLKPNTSAFQKFINHHSIESNDVCVFFEDSLDNLKKAKLLGWKTIYIGDLSYVPSYIDMIFPTIHKALNHFYVRFN